MQYETDQLLNIGKASRRYSKLQNNSLISTLKSLGIFRFRGCRGGSRNSVKSLNSSQGAHLPNLREIPELIETTDINRTRVAEENTRNICVDNLVKIKKVSSMCCCRRKKS